MNNKYTPEERARMEEAQRQVAACAECEPELAAAVITAFAAGLAIGEGRKQEGEACQSRA